MFKLTFKEKYKSSFLQKMVQSEIVACIAGAFVLWVSLGIRQTFGIFLLPITTETGWDRSTFSIASALLQLLWGFSQPFLVYLIEKRIGYGKGIFFTSLTYAIGCFLIYPSYSSSGLFIFAMGVVIGISVSGNSFPVVLASIGRRFPPKSKYQSIAFGIVSSFGSFGQSCFLPISRAMLVTIGWRYSFIVLGCIIVFMSPLAYFLQTIPQKTLIESSPIKMNEISTNDSIILNEFGTDSGSKASLNDIESSENTVVGSTKAVVKDALMSPSFYLITMGFGVCGYHVAFLTTHLPAFLQDNGTSSSLADWTISILGISSAGGTILCGFIMSYISPRWVLMAIYLVRTILLSVFIFIPVSVTTLTTFSVFFGIFMLSTVPATTKYIGDTFGYTYLGTLSSLTFVGHQIGSFLGAYTAGVAYDQIHNYSHTWYSTIALSVFAIFCNYFAGHKWVTKYNKNTE